MDPDSNGKACDEGAIIFGGGPYANQPTNTPATASAASDYGSASASAGLSMSVEEQAAQAEATCRIFAYAQEQGMSQQEANDFSNEVADGMADKFKEDPSLTAGPAENQALDDLGVPRYPECSGAGGEE
jgi:hypothetical protein